MDSLKTLFDAKKYELVIKLTKTSENPDDLFYTVASLTALSRFEEALFFIQDHAKLLETRLENLIPIHLELLCALNRIDQARSILDYYSNLPYQSQVVEEVLREAPNIISNAEKRNTKKDYSEDDIVEKLNSEEKEEILFGLDLLKRRDVLSFLPEVSAILTKCPYQSIRSLALMLLVQKEVDRELLFLSSEGTITVNPKKCLLPFTGKTFNEVTYRMGEEYKDVSLSEAGLQILSQYVIYTYPHEIKEEDIPYLVAGIYYLVNNLYYKNEMSIVELAKEKELDEDKLNKTIKKLDNIQKEI